MKIFYVATKYDYGDPARGHSFEHYNFYDSLVKMNGGGNEVVYFPFDEIILKYGKEKMNKKLLETVVAEKPDLCFFILTGEQIKKETVKKITHQQKIITLNWFCDDYWRFNNFSKHWAPFFNWVVTTDYEAIKKYQKIGYKNAIKSQWGCNHFLYRPVSSKKRRDVAFIGQPHSNRVEIVEKIKNSGIKIETWGRGWSNGRISQEDMIKVFSESKINLNLAKCSMSNIPKSLARVFLKREKNKKIRIRKPSRWADEFRSFLGHRRSEIKGRTFEIPGTGSLMMMDNVEDLGSYYKIGKEVVVYENAGDLIKKIKYYLKNKEEREKIAIAGYKRTLKEHTYEKRFNKIFKTIGFGDTANI